MNKWPLGKILLLICLNLFPIGSFALSFYTQDQLKLQSSTSCALALDEFRQLAVGPFDQDSDLALVYRTTCQNSILKWELLLETETEVSRIRARVDQINRGEIDGNPILIEPVQAIYFSDYHFQYADPSGIDSSLLDGFEAPQWVSSFSEVIQHKEKLKSILTNKDWTTYLGIVQSVLDPERNQKWLVDVWPKTQLLLLQIHSYFLLPHSKAKKSKLVFELVSETTKLTSENRAKEWKSLK